LEQPKESYNDIILDIEETKSEESEKLSELREGPFELAFSDELHSSMRLQEEDRQTRKIRSSGLTMTTSSC